MYEEKSDREIITEVLNGNDDLFYFLVRRYEKQILNYIYRLVKQKEEAEDLAQETFTKAFLLFINIIIPMSSLPGFFGLPLMFVEITSGEEKFSFFLLIPRWGKKKKQSGEN